MLQRVLKLKHSSTVTTTIRTKVRSCDDALALDQTPSHPRIMPISHPMFTPRRTPIIKFPPYALRHGEYRIGEPTNQPSRKQCISGTKHGCAYRLLSTYTHTREIKYLPTRCADWGAKPHRDNGGGGSPNNARCKIRSESSIAVPYVLFQIKLARQKHQNLCMYIQYIGNLMIW